MDLTVLPDESMDLTGLPDQQEPAGESLRQAPPSDMWESVGNFFADPKQDSARAVQALVDAEMVNEMNRIKTAPRRQAKTVRISPLTELMLPDAPQLTPSAAYRYRDAIDAGVAINPQAALLRSTISDRIKQSWDIGVQQNQQGELGYQYVMTGDAKYLDAMNAIAMPTEGETFISEGRLEDAFRSAAKLLPMMLDVGMEGGTKGIQVGMGFGIAAGILSGGTAAIPAAVVLGLKVGSIGGAFEGSLRKEAGGALGEILRFTDAEGKRIDPGIARAAAFGIGTINAGIEVAQIGTLLKTIPGLNAIFSKSVIETVASKTVKDKLLSLAALYSTTVAKETGQEMAQESINIVFEELAKVLNNNLKGTDIKPTDAAAVLARLKQTATESAQGFAVIAAPGVSVSGVKAVLPETPVAKPLQDAAAGFGNVVLGVHGDKAIVADESGRVTIAFATPEGIEARLSAFVPVDAQAVSAAVDKIIQAETITDADIETFIREIETAEGKTAQEAANNLAGFHQALTDAETLPAETLVAQAAAYIDADQIDEAMAPLTDIGKQIWDEGATDLPGFTAKMQERLGDLWERVKDIVTQIWQAVKDFNERLGERGAVGEATPKAVGGEIRILEITPVDDIIVVRFDRPGKSEPDSWISFNDFGR